MERTIYNALFAASCRWPADPLFRPLRRRPPIPSYRHLLLPLQLPPHHRRAAHDGLLPRGRRSGGEPLHRLHDEGRPGRRAVADRAQETDYPSSGHVVIHVDPSRPAIFPIRLRIPRWCGKPAMRVNPRSGEALPGTRPGQRLVGGRARSGGRATRSCSTCRWIGGWWPAGSGKRDGPR